MPDKFCIDDDCQGCGKSKAPADYVPPENPRCYINADYFGTPCKNPLRWIIHMPHDHIEVCNDHITHGLGETIVMTAHGRVVVEYYNY